MEENKVLTAEKFYESRGISIYEEYSDYQNEISYSNLYSIMNAYAKQHVKAALEKAAKEAYAFLDYKDNIVVAKGSILNAYPEDLIR